VLLCNLSPKTEFKKMTGKGVQPLNDYTCRFRPSSLKCTDKSGLDRLQTDKWNGNQGCLHLYAARRKMIFYFGEKLHFKMALTLEGGEFGCGALTLALFLAFCCKDSLDFLVIEPYKLIFKWSAWYV